MPGTPTCSRLTACCTPAHVPPAAKVKIIEVELGDEYGETTTRTDGGSQQNTRTAAITTTVNFNVPANSACKAVATVNTFLLMYSQEYGAWVPGHARSPFAMRQQATPQRWARGNNAAY